MRVFIAMRVYFFILLGAFLTLTPIVLAQQPQLKMESPEINSIESRETKLSQEVKWDLQKFIEMPDPKEAAEALKKHAAEHGLSLDSSPLSIDPYAERQFLKLSGLKIGLLINFHTKILKDGIIRLVNNF